MGHQPAADEAENIARIRSTHIKSDILERLTKDLNLWKKGHFRLEFEFPITDNSERAYQPTERCHRVLFEYCVLLSR